MWLPRDIGEAKALSDAEAEAIVVSARWPNGIRCPKCGSKYALRVGGVSHHEALFFCKARGCGKQFSLTAGARMHHTRLALRKWIIAYFVMESGFEELKLAQLRLELSADSLRSDSPLFAAILEFIDTEQELTLAHWLDWCCLPIEGATEAQIDSWQSDWLKILA